MALSPLESSSSSSSQSPFLNLFGTLPPLPPEFAWSSKGQLLRLGEKKDGSPLNTIVSEHPIHLVSVHTGEINQGDYSYAFRQWLPQQGWIDITLSGKTLFSSGGIAEMFGKGAVIHDNEAFKRFVVLSLNAFHSNKKSEAKYEQFGWKDGGKSFLVGMSLYGPGEPRIISGSDELKLRASWLMPTRSGSLGIWSQTVGELFSAKGFEPHVFALLASFGAPLMRFNSETEGGAIVSLVSQESGTGKSTALDAAATVWGQKRGTDLTEVDTGVSKAITLATLGNLPAIYDELSKRDPEVARDFVLMFTNGRDKMRGTTDGTIRHLAASWQTLLLTASNVSLVDTLNSLGGTDAPSFRVFELPAELGSTALSHSRGEALKKTLAANAGHAGAKYMRYLVQPDVSKELPKLVQAMTENVWDKTKLSSQHRFWVRAIAATAVAAGIVHKLEILPLDVQRVLDWAMGYSMGQRDETSTVTGKKAGSADTLSKFLIEHINTMLVCLKAAHPGRNIYVKPVIEPKGPLLYMRHDRDTGRLFIAEHALKAWGVKKGLFVRNIIQDLRAKDIVKATRMVTLGAGTDYTTGQVLCIEVDANHPALSGMLREVVDQKEVVNG